MKSESKLAGLGLLTAISASLCCIAPVLAFLAGTSGLAANVAWLEPLRPYLIGLTILVLGFAWYQNLAPQKQEDCDCDASAKTPFMQTKKFLGIVTVFAGLMLSFPLYAHLFYPVADKPTTQGHQATFQKAEFTIRGMTCSGCEKHIDQQVNQLPGIVHTTISYEKGQAIIEFDKEKTDMDDIEKAILKTGYAVTDKTAAK